MLNYDFIKQLRDEWIKNAPILNNEINFDYPDATANLLLSLQETENNTLNEDFIEALDIAIKIDRCHFTKLSSASQGLIQKLELHFEASQRNSSITLGEIEHSVKQARTLLNEMGLTITFPNVLKTLVLIYRRKCLTENNSQTRTPLQEFNIKTILKTKGFISEDLSDISAGLFRDPLPNYLSVYPINVKIIALNNLIYFADPYSKETFQKLCFQYAVLNSLAYDYNVENEKFILDTLLTPSNLFCDNIQIDSGLINYISSLKPKTLLESLIKKDPGNSLNLASLSTLGNEKTKNLKQTYLNKNGNLIKTSEHKKTNSLLTYSHNSSTDDDPMDTSFSSQDMTQILTIPNDKENIPRNGNTPHKTLNNYFFSVVKNSSPLKRKGVPEENTATTINNRCVLTRLK